MTNFHSPPLTLRHFLFLSIVLVEAIMLILLPQYREAAVPSWIECEKYPKTRPPHATEVIDTKKAN
jgi:hypothetical protein